MTDKEMAQKLINNFRLNVAEENKTTINLHLAKQCAIVCLDELIWYSCAYHQKLFFERVKDEVNKM